MKVDVKYMSPAEVIDMVCDDCEFKRPCRGREIKMLIERGQHCAYCAYHKSNLKEIPLWLVS